MGVMMVLFAIFWVLFGLVLFALASTALVWMIRALRQQGQGSAPVHARARAVDEPDRQ